jgi:hypothetical protein
MHQGVGEGRHAAGNQPELGADGLDDNTYDIAAQARAAWEAAVCWDPSGTDQFAVKRLAQVRAV